jgi:DeoR/GlpR family transcriptional regulator of sugar metabolism
MRAKERLNEIVKILNKQGRVHVKDLSLKFDVTEDLIRKDLKKLEEEDLIDRIYGGAERKSKKFDASNIKYRMNLHKEKKEILTGKAMALIENGDTLFLDTSSTCATLAMALSKSHLEVTVITNMLEIVRILEDNNNIRIILLGGLYDRQIGGFVGHEVIEEIKSYYVDIAFISCMSVDLEKGVLLSSTKDIGLTKKAMLDHARRSICMVESRKFNHNGLLKFYNLKDLDLFILDHKVQDNERSVFLEADIKYL